MNRTRRLLTTGFILSSVAGHFNIASAKGKPHHKSGQKLLGEKIKKDGKHILEKKGPHTVAVEVKQGKIAGMHVKHDKKGDLPITKYKSNKKMAQAEGLFHASYTPVQYQYLGTTYIGFAYYDDYGDEYIYWYPYEMVYDADTGVTEYIAA